MARPGPTGTGGAKPGAAAGGLMCPSASASAQDAVVIGIAAADADAPPRIAYLDAPLPVTPDILAATAPAAPNRVLRTAAACAEGACGHYDGHACTLATRLVAALDAAVDRPPACAIRPHCRWWRQEGKAACLRCPMVITDSDDAGEAFRAAARPPAGAASEAASTPPAFAPPPA